MNQQQPLSKTAHSSLLSPQKKRQNRILRQNKDRAATGLITVGGMAVLGAILLIFFYLLYEIMPLFRGADIEKQAQYKLTSYTQTPLYMAIEEQGEVAMHLDDDAVVHFFRVEDGVAINSQQLSGVDTGITAFGLDSEQSGIFAVAHGDGLVTIAKHRYTMRFVGEDRMITPGIEYPYGEEALQIANGEIAQLSIRDSSEAMTLIATTASGELFAKQFVKEEDFLSGDVTLEEEAVELPPLSIPVAYSLIGSDQRWLYLSSEDGQYQVIDIKTGMVVNTGRLIESGSVTEMRFLLGGISLLVAGDDGSIGQWFMVKSEEGIWNLTKIREFNETDTAIAKILPEHRRKGFYSLDSENQLHIFYTTSQRHLLVESLDKTPLVAAAQDPRAKRLMVLNEEGMITRYKVDNEHPEISFSALWSKVWYESYDEPEYLWQSSASNNDFEPKYSFSPLAFGTLKAAFYAMLFAAPLAICGAIYTANFMAPALRRKVKPLIELMEALPTVILGFFAGLWLAPFVEKNLPGIFCVLVLMPVSVVTFAYLWSKAPRKIRERIPDGWHVALIAPVVILVTMICFSASAPIEYLLFDGNMRLWMNDELGISFDQRNALIVGLAMGFAVIPTIFSIAEDAIFSVPKQLSWGSLALGATPWQTLVGVVIPTASPGIFSGLMIGLGRAVGETMIVLMATGNTPVMDANIFEGMRTLAANIAVEIGETEVDSSHYRVLFLAAFVLFMFTFVVNTAAEMVRHRLRKRYGSL